MGAIVQFVIAAVVAAVSVTSGSLLWPRFTDQPRPQVLERVKEAALTTEAGKNAALVLGVSDEKQIQKIRIDQMIVSGIDGVKNSLTARIETILVTQAVRELSRQFDKLPADQRTYIQEALCKPSPTPN